MHCFLYSLRAPRGRVAVERRPARPFWPWRRRAGTGWSRYPRATLALRFFALRVPPLALRRCPASTRCLSCARFPLLLHHREATWTPASSERPSWRAGGASWRTSFWGAATPGQRRGWRVRRPLAAAAAVDSAAADTPSASGRRCWAGRRRQCSGGWTARPKGSSPSTSLSVSCSSRATAPPYKAPPSAFSSPRRVFAVGTVALSKCPSRPKGLICVLLTMHTRTSSSTNGHLEQMEPPGSVAALGRLMDPDGNGRFGKGEVARPTRNRFFSVRSCRIRSRQRANGSSRLSGAPPVAHHCSMPFFLDQRPPSRVSPRPVPCCSHRSRPACSGSVWP